MKSIILSSELVCIQIKFLKSKEGAAMVQMGDGMAVERAMYNLNGVELFGKKLNLTYVCVRSFNHTKFL
jgi:hypothetical protein